MSSCTRVRCLFFGVTEKKRRPVWLSLDSVWIWSFIWVHLHHPFLNRIYWSERWFCYQRLWFPFFDSANWTVFFSPLFYTHKHTQSLFKSNSIYLLDDVFFLSFDVTPQRTLSGALTLIALTKYNIIFIQCTHVFPFYLICFSSTWCFACCFQFFLHGL